MNFPFSKPLDQYTNDELISLLDALKRKLDAILAEGRKRELLYFLADHEQTNLLNEIFGKDSEKPTESRPG